MAGLVPAIHALLFCTAEDVDARDIGVRKHAVLRTAMPAHDVEKPPLKLKPRKGSESAHKTAKSFHRNPKNHILSAFHSL